MYWRRLQASVKGIFIILLDTKCIMHWSRIDYVNYGCGAVKRSALGKVFYLVIQFQLTFFECTYIILMTSGEVASLDTITKIRAIFRVYLTLADSKSIHALG